MPPRTLETMYPAMPTSVPAMAASSAAMPPSLPTGMRDPGTLAECSTTAAGAARIATRPRLSVMCIPEATWRIAFIRRRSFL